MSSNSSALDGGEDEIAESARSHDGDQASLQLSTLLGSGRHGMVFLGLRDCAGTQTRVAVKVPSEPNGLDNERRALEMFSHPNIIELFEEQLSNGALVLEYCDDGTLADRLCDETLTLSELAALLVDLLPAVEEIHQQGWIHGDISPSNVGLRSTRGPALLDFATSRPSDGSTVDEGTAEFAGPLRQADPRLDIRSLGATALRALGDPDRWDHKKRQAQQLLTDLVARCDEDQPVVLNDFAHIVAFMGKPISAGLARRDLLGSGSDVNPTRAFGPRPTSQAVEESNELSHRSLSGILFAGTALVLVVAAAIELLGLPSMRSNRPDLGQAASLKAERPADETLWSASATWNADAGVVTIVDANGQTMHFAAGRSGDVAAIADWSCDGVATLGVFRPASSAWFEFDSWDEEALASPAPLDGGSSLWVSTDRQGCSEAVLR